MGSEVAELGCALGHSFADPQLLLTALTHSSHAHENGGEDYERLEFLGDAVFQLCSTELLVERFPEAREGQLSRLRSRMVNTHALAQLGRRLGIGPALRLGVGEEATGGRDRPRILAGAIEAILGAVFTDGGYTAALALARDWLEEDLAVLETARMRGWKDPRSLLQERAQREFGETPAYGVAARGGPAHQPTFTVEVRVGQRLLGRGEGRSKREAARNAAAEALASTELHPRGPS
ncbi:MAG TPA: ribonuclease III [Deltaproteobacteria bacterium]|nr:ribonuclease III [Deltaproteobacteria bacterium]